MSVVACIIETQQKRKNEMENKQARYTFGGFTFGSENYFNLRIDVKNYNGAGTSTSLELGLELTTEERMELIKVLINANEQEKN
jgi:hypothetical protein